MSSPASPSGSGFASRIAARYDELRPVDAGFETLLDELDAVAELRGTRLLDIGCGTGTFAVELATSYGCRVWAVDPSPEMLEVARRKRVPGVVFKRAAAENLPFRDGWFDRALLRSVVHHLDRPRALPEIRRVLHDGGRLVIDNIDPDGLEELWYTRFFPSLVELEQRRLPSADALEAELRADGYVRVTVHRRSVERRFDRAVALQKLHGRHTSSFDLLAEDEIEAGIARAERELGDEIRYPLHSLVVVAER